MPRRFFTISTCRWLEPARPMVPTVTRRRRHSATKSAKVRSGLSFFVQNCQPMIDQPKIGTKSSAL